MNLMKTAKIIIIASPIVAAVSFLALANQLVMKDAMINSIGMFITLLSLLMFIISLVVIAIKKAQESKIRKSTSKQEAKEIVQTIKTQTRMAKSVKNIADNKKTFPERIVGALLGVLLIPAIAINVIFFNPHILYVPVAIVMAIYGMFSKKRHPILESIFFIWALMIIFVLGGAFYVYHGILMLLNYTPTILDPNFRLVFFALPVLSIIGGLFFLLENIAVNICRKFNASTVLPNVLVFLIILIALTLPFFVSPKPQIGYATEYIMGGFNSSQLFILDPYTVKNAELSFDDLSQQWLVKVKLENRNQNPAAVKNIYLNKKKIDFNAEELLLDNVSVDKGYLVISPITKGSITIKSKEPIFRIFLEEDGGYIAGFGFLSRI